MSRGEHTWCFTAVLCLAAVAGACTRSQPIPDDRFRIAGATQATYADPGVDMMPGMDNNAKLDTAEIRGRNTWVNWTAGNEIFWDWMARHGYGTVDFLKLIDSRKRDHRFRDLGLINDPNLTTNTTADEYGLYIDKIVTPEPEGINHEVYGRPAGIMGLRLYKNPRFDKAAEDLWMKNKGKFYTDPAYFSDSGLVRPYVVGMGCGFCHVGPHPLNPPKDPEHPAFANMSTTIGAQYFRTAPVFAPAQDSGSFVYQLLLGYREGTLDTSLIPSDQIFNPSNMNAIFEIPGRLSDQITTPETMGAGNANIPGLKDLVPPGHPKVPHILKDGADNVGVIGALSRVFINIGEYSQQWLLDHDPIVGTKKQTPFYVDTAIAKSDYWNATSARLGDIAKYFIRVGGAMHLEDAPGGKAILAADAALVPQGRMVFAEKCANCHSSKQPPNPGTRRDTLAWFRTAVNAPDFLAGNYLSTDARIPVTEIGTNSCRAAGTNAAAGHIWDNFSSASYKESKQVAPFKVWNPWSPDSVTFALPAGGPGYYRPASLVSMWATAPYFHNNALGKITHDPSVAGRIDAFNDAVEKLLWPEKRLGKGSISRTTKVTWLSFPKSGMPSVLVDKLGTDTSALIHIGPIPDSTPVGLLGSLRLRTKQGLDYDVTALQAGINVFVALKAVAGKNLPPDSLRAIMRPLAPILLKPPLNNCPDLIEDGGHDYGAELKDADKRALIAFLKRL